MSHGPSGLLLTERFDYAVAVAGVDAQEGPQDGADVAVLSLSALSHLTPQLQVNTPQGELVLLHDDGPSIGASIPDHLTLSCPSCAGLMRAA